MNTTHKDSTQQKSPSDHAQSAGDNPPSDQPPPSDQAQPASDKLPSDQQAGWWKKLFHRVQASQGKNVGPAREEPQINTLVEDNEQRLWYITKYGKGKFPEADLKELIDIRNQFRNNPDFELSTDQEVQYRKSTMAAAEFLEGRHPEAIRLYITVLNKEKSNPLRKWLWGIGVALIVALLLSGYQTLIGNQIQRMRETREKYIEEATRLEVPGNDLARSLSKMCEQTIVYRSSAELLGFLTYPFYSKQSNADNVNKKVEFPGVCEVIAKEEIKLVAQSEGREAQIEFIEKNRLVIEKAQKAEFVRSEDRRVQLQAELYDSILALALLPMLYALLGALTSSVRTANKDFKSFTLTHVDGISLGARALLGLVGGATFGIVFSSDTLQGAAGLTILGLAFAVGYAVELFFNLLDGIKLGLGGSDKRAPESK